MAYTQADLDALQASMAKGVRRVRMNDEEVEFRSLSEMERMEARIRKELGLAPSGRIVKINTESGWR